LRNTYGTAENIQAVENAGIRAYVPLPNWDRTPFYGPSRFTYDVIRNWVRQADLDAGRRSAATG
jgi:hypothetical protein